MKQIKFSIPFPKLHDGTGLIDRAKLLHVMTVELADLSAELLDFDTWNGKYPLPKQGKFLMLIFLKPTYKDLFTTLRRWTPEKERYYRGAVGEILEILVDSPVKNLQS